MMNIACNWLWNQRSTADFMIHLIWMSSHIYNCCFIFWRICLIFSLRNQYLLHERIDDSVQIDKWTDDAASLVKEHKEAKKKINEVDDAKKTFLKIQIPKMEKEIKALKVTVADLLEADELDPRGEYFVLAKKLTA